MIKGKYLLVASLILYFIFLPSVMAINYNIEANDPKGDVVLLNQGGEWYKNVPAGDCPNVDLVYASTNEKKDNVIFTIRVAGSIDKSLRCSFNNDIFGSPGGGIWTSIYFNGIVQGYYQVEGKTEGGKIENASHEFGEDTLKITVPKNFFGNITNWQVSVNVDKMKGERECYMDRILSTQFFETTNDDKNAGGVPGFDVISIVVAVAIVFIYKMRFFGKL